MIEVWKDIKGYEGLYQVSNYGRVKSLDHIVTQKAKGNGTLSRLVRGRVLKTGRDKDGYCLIALSKNGKVRGFKVHRLVADAFIPLVQGKEIINHKDSNRRNNKVTNLEWCNTHENALHAYKYGSQKPFRAKKVLQYSKDGELVNEWNSIKEAGRKTGICSVGISRVCNSKKGSAGGFIWRFTE